MSLCVMCGWFWLVLVGFGVVLVGFSRFWMVLVSFGWSCGSCGKGTVADRGSSECPMVVVVVLGGFGWF